jgi:phosphoenolpyruvate carboxylase
MNDHAPSGPDALAADLLALVERAREHSHQDPFGNPVLTVALLISRRIDSGEISEAALERVVRDLRDAAFADRAARIRAYVGGLDGSDAAFDAVAARIARPDPADSPVRLREFRAAIERTRFAAVFTAHPTFSLPPPVSAALAHAASGEAPPRFPSHRPQRPTLGEEFAQATAAITNGRDALDGLTAALLRTAAATWPDRWRRLVPRPVILASWVGYDTDGRTDIGWWDTLRLRLVMKRLQLARVRAQAGGGPGEGAIAARLDEALETVDAQIAACPESADPDSVAAFAACLVGRRDAALVTPEPVLALFESAIAEAADPMALCVARWPVTGWRWRTPMCG